MLQNEYFLAKIGADTAENEQHFAEHLPKIGNYPTGHRLARGSNPSIAVQPRASLAATLVPPGAAILDRRSQNDRISTGTQKTAR